MLDPDRPDYRRSREAALLEGLRSQDPLALAEAYHRTSAAAHACARRVVGPGRNAEALLEALYAELWASPPETPRLEGWARSNSFRLGATHLRERDQPPASPSLRLLLPDLPAPEAGHLDAAEEILASLDEGDRRAVLLAHDQGVPAAAQEAPDAAAALDRALMALAGPGEGAQEGTAACTDLMELPDWVLGNLGADHAARITAEVMDRPGCTARSRALRRGRRRLEGLPPAPDVGQRVIASVLAGSSRPAPPAAPPPPAAAAPAGPGPSPAPDAPPPPPPSAPPPPAAPVTLPSALDEEPPPAEPTPPAPVVPDEADAAAPGTGAARAPSATALPEDVPADDDAATGEFPPVAEDAGEGAAAAGPAAGPAADEHRAEQTARATDLDEGGDVEVAEPREAEEDVGAREEDVAPPEEDADAAGEVRARPRGRAVARQLLKILAVMLVLGAGAAVGLLIGFLLVGGR